MPMEKYRKHSYENSMLARRRNNTATNMLQEQLKYMEQKYFRGYRQHLRERSRIQSELRVLEDITSGCGDDVVPRTICPNVQKQSPLEESYSRKSSSNRDARFFKHPLKSLPQLQAEHIRSENIPSSSRNRLEYSNNDTDNSNSDSPESVENVIDCLKISGHSNMSPVVHPDNQDFNNQQMPSADNIDTCTVLRLGNNSSENYHHTNVNNKLVRNKSIQFLKNENGEKVDTTVHAGALRDLNASSSQIFCKNNSEPQSRFLCNHFPCVTPTTYHSIVRRNNETSSESLETTTSMANQSKFEPKLKLSPERKFNKDCDNQPPETSFATSRPTTDGLQSSHNKTLLRARWRNSSSSHQLPLRQGNKSLFLPLPADPILESVRTSSREPPSLNHTGARISVRDKIRGLKQMTFEMRARNERAKPQDWAVNYGQQIPYRILVNPVLP